jgi:hypothetical protein
VVEKMVKTKYVPLGETTPGKLSTLFCFEKQGTGVSCGPFSQMVHHRKKYKQNLFLLERQPQEIY